ncbi:hypothetical protein [Streptomyces boluensis]|uniref:Uncharacterized protein n=1 Tax=Streptomyces boluensis TaxID=1775135 RepID=A0A964XK94_9ACTN|nr:hypothetical protein [Streptomyces boluensis]NBE51985.1 hypothetical protein [Streptomyces boluensis]
MPDHIHGDRDHSPHCTICLAREHTDYDAERAKDAAKYESVQATSSGPLLLWGCLLVCAIVATGLLIPVIAWRLS